MTYSGPDRPVQRGADPFLLAARERATRLLTDRYADESIDEAEFEARLYWLGAAESAARVDELVADLAAPRPRVAHAGIQMVREERLLAFMSSTDRSGHWTMPSRLLARAVMSELTIDLCHASLPPVAEIDLLALMANVRIVVPPEIEVECTISPMMGTVRNESGRAGWPRQGVPSRLVVRGTCVMAEVRIEVAPRLGWQG